MALLAYTCVVLWTIRYHEKWADEAQAWLIARDLDLRTIWFHELRYEGSPGLWHTLLWVAQHVFHLGYGAIGYIGLGFAIAGAAVLLFKAPFPRIVRWPLAFTYVMVYQYAVIARPYTLLPLLAFCAAILFMDLQHPERMTVVLILLATLTIHGTILAGCLGLSYLIEAIKRWDTFDSVVRRKYAISLAVMACTFVFLLAILKPTPDVEVVVAKNQFAQAPPALKVRLPGIGDSLISVISGAFLDWFVPSIVFVLLLALWSLWRRKWLSFILPVGVLIAFYGAVYGSAHHHGTVFVAAITGLWIAWPSEKERLAFNGHDQFALIAVNGLLLILCTINLWDAGVVIKREYLYPYSGAEDAAKYLKAVGADRAPMFGWPYGVVGVQAFFDHNLFMNHPTAYFHHGLPLEGAVLDVDRLDLVKPEYAVACSTDPQQQLEKAIGGMNSLGYELAHFSDGYYLYKRSVYERQTCLIFRRSAANVGSLPLGLGAGQDSNKN